MPSNLNLDYYYGTEAEQYSFYRVPKTLLTDPRYKGVSIEAKVLYGLLLDRMSLSVRNGWMDKDRRVYIYFTQEDAMALMSCGKEEIDGYVELMAETCASRREYIRVNGEDVPTELVRKRFLRLDGEHIRYVMDSLRQNTAQVVNIRAYTLAALYNAPVTISQYYAAQVSRDMAQGFGGA